MQTEVAMTIHQHILSDLKIQDIHKKIEDIQGYFEHHTYSHIPVEQNGEFAGCISENDIHSFDAGKTLEEYQYALENFYVRDHDNWLDVLSAFAKNKTNLLPVLDNQNEYLGYVELDDFINLFTETPFLNALGGIVIVEKGYKEYSFSEISQIVESNGAHLLGAFLSQVENDMAQITLKIGQSGLNTILQSFRRYGYTIISNHQEDNFKLSLEERSGYLDKYLNI